MSTPANSLNLTTSGIVKYNGISTFSSETVTNHAVVVGAASNGLTSVVGTSNTVLVGSTGADPSFTTVPAGALPGSGAVTLSNGTNISVTGSPLSLGGAATINVAGPPSATTLTNHGVVIGQGTSAVVATAAGSSGQILRSGGASADPTYSTATYPATAGTSGNVLTSDGTNWVSSTPAAGTVTSVSGTANRITSTGGATPVIDIAATYVGQTSITTLGTVATGTWSATTIAANKGGTGQVTNTNHGVLIGQGSSSIVATAAGTAGQVLQSGGASADPAYSTATYPSTAGTNGTFLQSNGTNIVNSTALTNGQLWIGNGGNPPSATTLTAGTGITITNGSGSITISAAGGSVVPTLTFISSSTASGGTVDFTGLSSTYKGYRFYLVALTPSSADTICVRCSTDNGGSFDAGNNYQSVSSAAGQSGSSISGSGFITYSTTTPSALGMTGHIDAYFTTTTNAFVTFDAQTSTGTSGVGTSWFKGQYNVQANVDALRFTVLGANNLASGAIYMYGIS